MPASTARTAFGTLFKLGDGAGPEVFTTLAEVVEISSFGASHEVAEVTNMSSPNGWAEFIGLGVKTGKAFSISLNFVADNAAQISLFDTRMASGGTHNYQILLTDVGATTITFGAIVVDFDTTLAVKGKADITIQFQPTGAYTYA